MVKVLKSKGERKTVQTKKVERPSPQQQEPVDQRAESLKMLSQFYLGEMDLSMKMRQMKIEKGQEVPEWMAALEILKDRVINTEHPDLKLKMYQGMVDLLAKLGHMEDLHTIQEIIARYNLKSFKDIGFDRVEVECVKDACPTCRKMAGKRFTIAEAVETMPLPCHGCTTKIEAAEGYCRCRYFAVF